MNRQRFSHLLLLSITPWLSGCGAWIALGAGVANAVDGGGSSTTVTDAPPVAQAQLPLDLSATQTSPVAIPFVLSDSAERSVRVIVQHQSANREFPDLNMIESNEQLDAILADPAQRQALRIITEQPLRREATVQVGSTRTSLVTASLGGQIPLAALVGSTASVQTTGGTETGLITGYQNGRLSLDTALLNDPIPGSTLIVQRPGLEATTLATRTLEQGGQTHVLIWDARADIDTQAGSNRLRVTPFIDGEFGVSVTSAAAGLEIQQLYRESVRSPLLRDGFRPGALVSAPFGVISQPVSPDVPHFVAVTDTQNNDLAVFLPDSEGLLSTTPTVILAPGGSPTNVQCGDFNNDDRVDLALITDSNQVFLYFQSPTGFSGPAEVTLPTAPGPILVKGMDINTDGLDDLLVLSSAMNQRLRVFLQDSANPGQFLAFFNIPAMQIVDRAIDFTLGDVGMGGFRDLILVGSGLRAGSGPGSPSLGVMRILNHEGGQNYGRKYNVSQANPSSVVARDTNGDGFVEIYSSDRGQVIADEGFFIYSSEQASISEAQPGSSRLVVFDRSVTVRGEPTPDGPSRMFFQDLNGDLKDDLVLVTENSSVAFFFNKAQNVGEFQFLDLQDFVVVGSISQVDAVVGNFTGRGLADVASLSTNTRKVEVYTSANDRFPNDETNPITLDFGTSCIALGDVSGDGFTDFVVGNADNNDFQGFRFDVQTFSFANRVVLRTADLRNTFVSQSVAIADVNNDGRNDFVTLFAGRTGTPGRVALFTQSYETLLSFGVNSPEGGPTQELIGPDNRLLRSVTVGDFNSDGRNDIAFLANNTQMPAMSQIHVYLQDVMGQFADSPSLMIMAGPTIMDLEAGDVDGDGRADLVCCNSGGQLLVFRQTIANNLPMMASATLTIGNDPTDLELSDLDRDGLLDILVVDKGDDSLRIFFQSSTLMFDAPAVLMTGPDPTAVVAVDLSGDGQPDILVANSNLDGVVPNGPVLGDSLSYYTQAQSRQFLRQDIQRDFASQPLAIATGDLDADGQDDVAVLNQAGQVAIFLSEGQ